MARNVGATVRLFMLMAVAVVMAVLLAACGSSAGSGTSSGAGQERAGELGPEGDAAWAEIVEAAKQEGSVTFYAGYANDVLNDVAARFEEAYGIDVNIVRDVDSTLQQKVEAEQATGRVVADVTSSTTVSWMEDRGAGGHFVEASGPAFDNPDYDEDALRMDGGGFIVSSSVSTYAWNTDRLPDGLTGYGDFLKPELADGKIGIIQPMSGAIVDFYEYLKQQEGENFLEELAVQNPRIYPSALPMAEAVNSGEIAAGIYVRNQTSAREVGAPVENGIPDEPWGARYMAAIVNGSPNPNAAKVFANFLLTPSAQEPLAFEGASVLPNIEGALTTLDNIATQDPEVITPEYQAEFRQEFDRLFT